jgi:hypothetical protein
MDICCRRPSAAHTPQAFEIQTETLPLQNEFDKRTKQEHIASSAIIPDLTGPDRPGMILPDRPARRGGDQ